MLGDVVQPDRLGAGRSAARGSPRPRGSSPMARRASSSMPLVTKRASSRRSLVEDAERRVARAGQLARRRAGCARAASRGRARRSAPGRPPASRSRRCDAIGGHVDGALAHATQRRIRRHSDPVGDAARAPPRSSPQRCPRKARMREAPRRPTMRTCTRSGIRRHRCGWSSPAAGSPPSRRSWRCARSPATGRGSTSSPRARALLPPGGHRRGLQRRAARSATTWGRSPPTWARPLQRPPGRRRPASARPSGWPATRTWTTTSWSWRSARAPSRRSAERRRSATSATSACPRHARRPAARRGGAPGLRRAHRLLLAAAALRAGAELRRRGRRGPASDAEIAIVTPERAPLELFGAEAGEPGGRRAERPPRALRRPVRRVGVRARRARCASTTAAP